MVDCHNHLIPGVDDGSASLDQSRLALQDMAFQGVSAVLCTPHFDASLLESPAAAAARFAVLDAAWTAFAAMAAAEFPDLRVARGVELMLDIPRPLATDPRLFLAGSQFLLVEFPGMDVPVGADVALDHLLAHGVQPVLAHPERYPAVWRRPDLIGEWRQRGCLVQINAGSPLGRYGGSCRRSALALLSRGWVDVVASDYHARGSLPSRACYDLLVAHGDLRRAELLTIENPRRLMEGLDPLSVEPLEVAVGWRRWFGH